MWMKRKDNVDENEDVSENYGQKHFSVLRIVFSELGGLFVIRGFISTECFIFKWI